LSEGRSSVRLAAIKVCSFKEPLARVQESLASSPRPVFAQRSLAGEVVWIFKRCVTADDIAALGATVVGNIKDSKCTMGFIPDTSKIDMSFLGGGRQALAQKKKLFRAGYAAALRADADADGSDYLVFKTCGELGVALDRNHRPATLYPFRSSGVVGREWPVLT
jgi:hypothetical protein